MSAASATHPRIAIVGASSLLGKELKQVIEDRHFPATDVVLLDESVMAGTLTEAAGEPTFIRALEEDSFEGARLVFFAGSPGEAARNWPAALRAGASVIDLTGAARSDSQAQMLIPGLHSVLPPSTAIRANGSARTALYLSPAAPVLIACTLSAALHRFSPQRIVLVLFAPVCELDQPGIEELESQTASLLSFREVPKNIFDTQVAFNLLPAFGAASKTRLPDIRAAIVRDTTAFLAGRAQVPAIQLLHAPVFYGYAFAAYAEFSSPIAAADLESALVSLGSKIEERGEPLPSNVSVAGESEIHFAPFETDSSIPNGVWLWGAADNLRLAAVNAVRIAEDFLRES